MIYLRIALAALIFAGGWIARGYKADSDELMVKKAVDSAVAEQSKKEQKAGETLEASLMNLNRQFMKVANDRQTYLKNPVYSNPCRDPAGVHAINLLSGADDESGQPARQVP